MFLTLHLCRRNTFSWLYSCSVCPWDIEFSLGRHKMLVKRAIRLPNMFWSHNIVFKGKSQAKVMYFIKLAILTFGCPKDMYITNFTRMPLPQQLFCLILLILLPKFFQRRNVSTNIVSNATRF